jgi:PAS domain S-box-containing protein
MRWLRPDDLIVSKTDTKGVITYANRTFLEMAKFREEDILGKPHNIIRHPDMPRTVFKYLWDTIEDGQEVFAYVLNMASDGAGYWVLAHVTATFDQHGRIVGYHSNRRAPHRQAVEAVSGVYELLLAEEQNHPKPSEALAAGEALLAKVLAGAGVTYDEFFWSVTPE